MKNKLDFGIALALAFSHPMGEGETFAASNKMPRLDLPDAHSQNENQSLAVPSPVGRERVRVRAIPFSVPQPTKQNNNTTLKQKYENLLAPRR
jgi:hypothetical protein